MRAHLHLHVTEPSLDPVERCERLELSLHTWLHWTRDRAFRQWWNEELTQAQHLEIGGTLQTLRALLQNERLDARDRVRACEVFLNHVGKQRGQERSAAVAAMLEAFGAARGGSSMRMRAAKAPDGTEVVEAEVSPMGRAARAEMEGEDLGVLQATPSASIRMGRAVDAARAVVTEALERGAKQAADDAQIPSSPAPIPPAPRVRKRHNTTEDLLSEPEGKRRATSVDSEGLTRSSTINPMGGQVGAEAKPSGRGEGWSEITGSGRELPAGRARSGPTRGVGQGAADQEPPAGVAATHGAERDRDAPEHAGAGSTPALGATSEPLLPLCSACGAEPSPGRRFPERCDECGAWLARDEHPGDGAVADARAGGGVRSSQEQQEIAPAAGSSSAPRRPTREDFRAGLPAGVQPIDESRDGVP